MTEREIVGSVRDISGKPRPPANNQINGALPLTPLATSGTSYASSLFRRCKPLHESTWEVLGQVSSVH